MSITFLLEWHIKPEAVDEVKQRIKELIESTRAFDGCEGVQVLQDADDPTTILMYQHWASREHQARYREYRYETGDAQWFNEAIVDRSRRFFNDTGI